VQRPPLHERSGEFVLFSPPLFAGVMDMITDLPRPNDKPSSNWVVEPKKRRSKNQSKMADGVRHLADIKTSYEERESQ
jgi:hypothetical protein